MFHVCDCNNSSPKGMLIITVLHPLRWCNVVSVVKDASFFSSSTSKVFDVMLVRHVPNGDLQTSNCEVKIHIHLHLVGTQMTQNHHAHILKSMSTLRSGAKKSTEVTIQVMSLLVEENDMTMQELLQIVMSVEKHYLAGRRMWIDQRKIFRRNQKRAPKREVISHCQQTRIASSCTMRNQIRFVLFQ